MKLNFNESNSKFGLTVENWEEAIKEVVTILGKNGYADSSYKDNY